MNEKKPRKTRREQRQDKLLKALMATMHTVASGMHLCDVIEMAGVFLVGVIEVAERDGGSPVDVWDELEPKLRQMIVMGEKWSDA